MTRLFHPRAIRAQLAAVVLLAALASIATAGDSAPNVCGSDSQYGTQISWVEDVSVAQREAVKRDRLLMVMQISGDFSKPTFT